MFNLMFDLQKFGGKGGTTIQSTYTPTEYELQFQQLEVEYTEAIMPNALSLNSSAATLLSTSIGTIPQDYASLLANGRATLDTAVYGIYEAAKYIHDNTEAIDDDLVNVINPANTTWSSDMAAYADHLDTMTAHVNDFQNEVYGGFSYMLDELVSNYSSIVGGYSTAFSIADSRMGSLPTKFTNAETLNSSNLNTIAGNLSGEKVIEGDYGYSSGGLIIPLTTMDYNLTKVAKTAN